MGYLFLSLALFVGLLKGFCGKKMSGFVKSTTDSMFVSAVRMFLCVVIGFFVVLFAGGSFSSFSIDGAALLIAAVSGCATAIFVVAWLLCVKNGAFMVVETFVTLGIFVSVLFCWIFLGETVVWLKWLGLTLLVVATYVMCSYNNNIKTKLNKKSYGLLILSGFANGLVQFSQKWFNFEMTSRMAVGMETVDASTFNFYTYIFTLLVIALCLVFFQGKEEKKGISSWREVLKNVALCVSVMAVCLFLHSYFTILAGGYLASSELYPLQQGLSLVGSLIMSAIFFKEKITKKCVLGVTLIFLSLLLINVLPSLISI